MIYQLKWITRALLKEKMSFKINFKKLLIYLLGDLALKKKKELSTYYRPDVRLAMHDYSETCFKKEINEM